MAHQDSLLVDIGNSSCTTAVYSRGVILDVTTCPTSELPSSLTDLRIETYKNVLVSSVVPDLNSLFSGHSDCVFVDADTIPDLAVEMADAKEVGADRLVNALAAYKKVGTSCLIVDSGTAITFCYVDENGVYQGGEIFAGMQICSNALNDYTAKIPRIRVERFTELCGKNTEEAVQAGFYRGYIHLINGIIDDFRRMDPDVTVFGTGNGLSILEGKVKIDRFEPNLILDGLKAIAESLSQR